MMSRHFRLNSEFSGAIAKRLRHAKNQFSVPGSFFNQFVCTLNTAYFGLVRTHFSGSEFIYYIDSYAISTRLVRAYG